MGIEKLVHIVIGMFIGLWAFLSPPTFFLINVGLIVGFIFCDRPQNIIEKRALRKIYVTVFIACVILSAVNFYLAVFCKKDSDMNGDGSAYSSHGLYIAEVLAGRKYNVRAGYVDVEEVKTCYDNYKGGLPPYGYYRMGFYSYFQGLFYYLFGYSPVSIKLLNSILGILACMLVYYWMRDTFGCKQAQISLFLILLLPTRLIWSASGVRDSWAFLSYSIALFAFYRLQKTAGIIKTVMALLLVSFNNIIVCISVLLFIVLRSIKKGDIVVLMVNVGLLKMACILLREIRPALSWPLIVVLYVSLCAFLSKRVLVAVSFCFLSIILLTILVHDKSKLQERYNLETLEMVRVQKARGENAETQFRIYPDRFYDKTIPLNQISPLTPIELIISYFIGMSYQFLSPFPWWIINKALLLLYLQSILIYIIMPFVFIGVIIALRYFWRQSFPYLLFIGIISSICSLFSGNVGTVLRHRDMYLPFFIAFAGIGLTHVFCNGKAKKDKTKKVYL